MNENEGTFDMDDMRKREGYEYQKTLQHSWIRQKNLIERIDELTKKVVLLGGDPQQLELNI